MDSKLKGHLFVSLSGILSGFIVFGGQVFINLGLSLFEISIIPYALAAIWMVPFVLRKDFVFPRKHLFALFVYGLVTAFCVLAQFGGIIFGASVAVVVLLLYSQPLWTILIGAFFLKENISKHQLLACALVLIGVYFLVDPTNLFASSSWVGVLVALLGGVFLSLWVVVGREVSRKGIVPTTIVFFEEIFSVVVVVLSYPIILLFISESKVVSFSLVHPPFIWLLLLVFSLFTIVINHLAYLRGSKHISAINAGIIMLLEPVVGVLLSVVFLAQPLTVPVIVGGVLILFGNYLVIVKG